MLCYKVKTKPKIKRTVKIKYKQNTKSLRQLSRIDYFHLSSRSFQTRSKFFSWFAKVAIG